MRKRVFFKSFFITFGIMLMCYGVLYFSVTGRTKETDISQTGVPVNHPSPKDSRTVFVSVGDDEGRFFFIVKFNGFQSKVSVISISPGYVYPSKGRSLSQSMAMAGVMQCVLDTKEEFGINIDNYIDCSWDGARKLVENFTEFGIDELGSSLPPVIKTFLLKSREKLDADSMINAVERANRFMDNDIGLAFLNEGLYLLLKYNSENICRYAGRRLKANYSSIESNINSAALDDYQRILNFIDPTITEYLREIIVTGEENGAEKIKAAVLE